MCKKSIYLVSFILILSMVSYVQADKITVGSDADTYVGGVGTHGDATGMYLQNTDNYVGYLRFDLSGLDIITIRSATLTLTISGDTPRNDNPVTGRFALNGLDNIAGNTAQDWDEAVLDVNTVGAEWSTNGGEPLVNVTVMDMNEADLAAGLVPAITETIAGSGDYWLPGARTITVTGDPLASFIQSRIDDGGLVTFILEFPGGGSGRGYGLATKENADEALRPKLELNAITETTPKIIFVTSIKDNDQDGVQDDISWVNWLEAEGYEVDARPGNWSDPLDANDIAELEAADLVLASRGMATGEYDGAETDKWNALSTPILCTNAWMIRSNRWVWMNSTAANKDAGAPLLLAVDPTHPIFAGVPLDSDGLVEILDPNVGSGHTSFLNDILDVGNGMLLAQSLGIYNTTWIAEWDAGVEYYAGAGQIAGGKRMLFMAGTQDDPYTVPDSTLIMPVGVFNLNEAGQQLLRNIIAYLLKPPAPKIIFVTSVKDNDQNGIQDDQSWVDWLEAEGYDVDARPGNWIDPLDANEIAELEAADLIIASRGMATGEYDGDEVPKWNAITTPILCTNAWMVRNNRWLWMNSGSANKDAGSPLMLVLDPTHPIFEGVPVDADGLVEVLDPNVGSGHTSFLNDILDVGNGTLLAQSLGIYNTTWIAEWEAGVEYYEGAGQIAGGKRMLFMAGTQDDPYTVPDSTLIMPVGVFNLNEAGQQLLRNIITYVLTP